MNKALLKELMELTPEERILRNVHFVALIEALRRGRPEPDGSPRDLPGTR